MNTTTTMPTCSICGHTGLDHRSSADCVARLLHQLAEGRAEYARLEERYNALAGTLRAIVQQEGPTALGIKAQRALAFAGDPEIDR